MRCVAQRPLLSQAANRVRLRHERGAKYRQKTLEESLVPLIAEFFNSIDHLRKFGSEFSITGVDPFTAPALVPPSGVDDRASRRAICSGRHRSLASRASFASTEVGPLRRADCPKRKNVVFAVIETHPSHGLHRTHDKRTPYAVDVTGGGRGSATSRRMSVNRFSEWRPRPSGSRHSGRG